MGNQVSTKKRRITEKKKTSSVSSGRAFSDSFNNNTSTLSGCQPKFSLEIEADSLRQQSSHYLMKHLFQKAYFAPIDNLLSQPDSAALDIGCGSQASWLLDVSPDFPNCTFYGFDLLDIFEEGQGILIPNNCRLKKHDVFDGLAYKDNTFDFVHQRTMHLVYPQDKIPWLFEEILRVTKDNGWVELIEPDLSPKRCGPLFEKVYNAVRITIKELFGSPLHGPSLVKRMSEAGLVDIQTDYGSLPVCWGGYIGKLVYENALQGFRVFGPAIFEHLELEGEFDSESFDDLLDKAFDECVEYQTFFNIRWAYGRKSSSPSTS